MMDYSNFDRVFGSVDSFPYHRNFIQEAEVNRRSFDGALFIDRVLGALGLSKVVKNYPPKSEAILRQIHESIASPATIATHHKLSVLFYFLLDIDEQSPANFSRADRFASRAGVPPKYQVFMRGLWCLDRQAFTAALEFLAHPSLLPEFADDIITVLVRCASKGGDYTLPLAYYHTVQPVLKSPTSIQLLFDAMAHSNVTEALQFSRARPQEMQQQLFHRLVMSVLGDARDEESAERAYQLASLPLYKNEEGWLKEALTSGHAKRFKGARDTLLMRRIAVGESGVIGDKGAWVVLMEGFKVGSGGRT
ncbi:nuclear pore complex assembly-domain-containing protein [Pseudomassariella vexata]|uniref:Nuclear pore complex assembly-domain-containing protein n=1 Tax=Pseudomassariella vexata TaxID=1141098 RepID=A0A1Y2EAR0_9PEZI|nr:nuclear pore complex assembly-domain-containing protein [Pseudomassariella vexata]ORY68346.1 nuclear pore complex assembly-domain-containing protein [Pseudomassariella vexata]